MHSRARLAVLAIAVLVTLGAAFASISSSLGATAAAVGGATMALFAAVLTAVPYFRERYVAANITETRTTANSVASLLDPRRALVGFVGREKELVSLISWCTDDRRDRVRLITGPGGVGKTRLSVALANQLEATGWRSARVADGAEATILSELRRSWKGPTLLVVDYAETRAKLIELLRSIASDPGTVRVLLLARSAGDWWDRLSSAAPATREILADAYAGVSLSETVADDLSSRELVLAAVPVFAAALGVPTPADIAIRIDSLPVRILDLHAAALVAVLQSVNKASSSVKTSTVLDELLKHEERFWQGTAERAGLLQGTAGMTIVTLRQIVAVAALLGSTTQDQAVALLRRVPGAVASVKVASWLRDLYPPKQAEQSGSTTNWLGMLEPSRLAERLVVMELANSPVLAERCLTALDESQALRALTLLGRASTDQPAASQLLLQVLPFLDAVVEGLPADVDLLTEISDAIPYPSLALAEADVAVTRRILQALPPDASTMRGHWLSGLGTALSQIGHPVEALVAEQEAVTIRRELASADPDRYRPDLAASLSNLGVTLAALGRPSEALVAEQEAVTIRRELASADPDRYRPDLAASLSHLGVQYSALGRTVEALIVEQEAVTIRRELASAKPDQYQPDLAASLSNLGIRFAELGRPAEALPTAQEAADVYRELAASYPDRYRPELATSLSNLGVIMAALGRPAEALVAEQEAVVIRQELASAYPDRYLPALAASLSNLGIRFAELGRSAEALPVVQETVDVFRELAAAYPDRYRPDLAASLSNLGALFAELNRFDEAAPITQEAVDIYRELSTANPARYEHHLARSLRVLALALDGQGHAAEAEAARHDADLTNNQ